MLGFETNFTLDNNVIIKYVDIYSICLYEDHCKIITRLYVNKDSYDAGASEVQTSNIIVVEPNFDDYFSEEILSNHSIREQARLYLQNLPLYKQ